MNIVLVVDDTWELRELFMETLSDAGYEVHGAANGLEALNALDSLEGKPCVVLLDMMMPVMDGHAFLQVLRDEARLPDLPVVVISAVQQGPMTGVRRVLRKPVDVEVLLAAVAMCGTPAGAHR